jgi:reactive intermediate/imine deaminase
MHPKRHTAASLSTPPGYSHAMQAGGLLFISGQVPLDGEGRVIGVDDMAEQTRQVFRNLGAVLEAAGVSFADLVKLTIFVTDINAIAEIRASRDEFIDTANPPSSSLVEVSRLFRPDILVEIEAIAVASPSP